MTPIRRGGGPRFCFSIGVWPSPVGFRSGVLARGRAGARAAAHDAVERGAVGKVLIDIG